MTALSWALWTVLSVTNPSAAPLALELPDLDGRHGVVAAPEQRPGVVMVVQARRLRGLKAWEKQLRSRFDDLHVSRIADVPDASVSYDDVATKLRNRVPDEVRVFVDTDRSWARGLELDTSRPNLVLIDRDGSVTATFRGRYEPELFERVCAAIDDLLERAP